ncbi:DUF6348 family protein [Mucilaginibacter gynuensis]|uniref:DUF6348 family protein n=1 Tax=Mucilaginibacter gynuensis TaxID=1302236 RepID=A0ABP8FUH4_9SPHI
MKEIILNDHLAKILRHHGINVNHDDDFIYTDLNIKLRAKSFYQPIGNYISSQLDVNVVTTAGETITESLGDIGVDLESAINKNFDNFGSGSLHVLLAAFGCKIPEVLYYAGVEDWNINGTIWKAYVGLLTPKMMGENTTDVNPANSFFAAFEAAVKSQSLNKNLHWFRGFYTQQKDQISSTEFLMDNHSVDNAGLIFASVPIIPGVEFYSCRNFMILRRQER